MRKQSIKNVAVGLAVLGTATVAGIGLAPAAHAASVAPSVSASITDFGTTEDISFSGTGFTPNGTVNIYIYDSTTGKLVQTIPVYATATTASTTYTTQAQTECAVPSLDANEAGQQCHVTAVQVPQTTYTNEGAVSALLPLTYTSDELIVEGVDATTGALSNQVILNAPALTAATATTPTLSATLGAYGYTNWLLLSGSGYTVGSNLSVELIDTANGTILQTIPIPQSAYNSDGTLSFTVPSPVTTDQVAVQIVNPASGWTGSQILLY